MSEMVERLARAIAASDRAGGFAIDMARAVLSEIEAMGMVVVPRVPTEEMVRFGEDVTSEAYGDEAWCDPEDVWKAMIAAAPKPDGG